MINGIKTPDRCILKANEKGGIELMKLKLMGLVLASSLALVGCQNTNDEQGMNDRNNRSIDQTRNVERDQNRMYDQVRNTPNDNSPLDRNNRMNEINEDQRNNNERGNNDNAGDNRYEVSQEAADRITDELSEIDRAYVLTMGKQAYVAAVLDNDQQGEVNNNRNMNRNRNNNSTNMSSQNMRNQNTDDGDLTESVKSKIADIVQSVDSDIDNVFVTTNPDFADLTNNYVNDMNNGKPIRGFFDQIGNMVQRLFPANQK